MNIHIEVATLDHARAIASELRVFGCGDIGARPEDVERHVERSIEAWTWLDGDKPVAMAGVLPRNILGAVGVVWVATTPQAFRSRRVFWVASKALVAYLRHQYTRIEGVVDVNFEASQRWARRLGFRVIEQPFEYEGIRAFPIVMEG